MDKKPILSLITDKCSSTNPNSHPDLNRIYKYGSSMNTSSSRQVLVGIDVSGEQLAVHILPDETFFETGTDPQSLKALGDKLADLKPAEILLEATGGIERPVVAHCI